MKLLIEKIAAVVAGTWIGSKLGLLVPMIFLLALLMMIDYISGMLASKKEAIEHPDVKEYGWSSKKSILGIYKKAGYMLTIFVAISIDFLIYKVADEINLQYNTGTMFGLMITIWFIINEIISILENAGRMGVELPEFLRKCLAEIKNDINNGE